MVLTSLGQTEHKVASDIVWTMNFGVGTDRNHVLPTMRQLEPRMHQFWASFECHAETMLLEEKPAHHPLEPLDVALKHTGWMPPAYLYSLTKSAKVEKEDVSLTVI
jgi:hypothetical protein